jgi:hypothetical protein
MIIYSHFDYIKEQLKQIRIGVIDRRKKNESVIFCILPHFFNCKNSDPTIGMGNGIAMEWGFWIFIGGIFIIK